MVSFHAFSSKKHLGSVQLEEYWKSQGLFSWRSTGKVEGQKIVRGWKSGRMEKWEDKKDFIFSPICLVESGKVEGWKK